MYLGGRFVFGSGNCWPQDFLFFTCFFSGAGVPATLPPLEPPNMLSSSNDSGLISSLLSMDSKREGYCVPGVEVKLSAKLSVGESSNLIWGVVDIVKDECNIILIWLENQVGWWDCLLQMDDGRSLDSDVFHDDEDSCPLVRSYVRRWVNEQWPGMKATALYDGWPYWPMRTIIELCS